MQKILLLSVIFVSLAVPIHAAKLSRVRKGWQETMIGYVIFCVLYGVALLWVYPALK